MAWPLLRTEPGLLEGTRSIWSRDLAASSAGAGVPPPPPQATTTVATMAARKAARCLIRPPMNAGPAKTRGYYSNRLSFLSQGGCAVFVEPVVPAGGRVRERRGPAEVGGQ